MREIGEVLRGSVSPLAWIASGRKPVERDLANSRAAACVACPRNGTGPLTQWFTEPVSKLIGAAIQQRADWKMETIYDAALGVCEACYCPIKTKVHEPIDLVLKGLSLTAKEKLWDRCWITRETSEPDQQPSTESE